MSLNDDLSKNWHYNLRIYSENSASYWDNIILCQVNSLLKESHRFCDVNEQLDPHLINIFGSPKPPPANYLLHLAPGWNRNTIKTPVILVHGAGLDATSYTNLYNMGYVGLQQQLVALGYRVFAVTFAHSHGDNFHQAEALAHAIKKVKDLTNSPQVNLIAHSKGGIACRIYLSNLASTPYQGDVKQYIMLGTPNMGTDYAFRNPSISYLIYLAGGNGVIAWDKILVMGNFVDVSSRAIYKDGSFPGQCQMLYRWDDYYPLDVTQQDWWTTYYGGTGFMSSSRGINTAIADGNNLIEKLDKHGLEPEIRYSVLAGDKNNFGFIPSGSIVPGDGILILDSVLHTTGLSRKGAVLQEKTILPLNHIELLYDFRVARWINKQLKD